MKRSRSAFGAARGAAIGWVTLLGVAGAVVTPGCGRAVLNCPWRSQAIVVDGRTGDWSGTWYSFADDRIVMSVTNDGEFLYLGLAPSEMGAQAQITHGGLTIWFDPQGGKDRSFGIRYPLGREGRPARPDSLRGDRRPDAEAMRREFEGRLGELEILTDGGNGRERMPVSEARGIEVRAGFSEEQLACEFKIPLRADLEHPFAAGTIAGQALGIGVEVPGFDRGERSMGRGERGGPGGGPGGGPDAPGGPPPGGGRGGPEGGGMRGGAGHGGGRGPQGSSGPIEFWIRVRPATRTTAP